MPTAVVNTNYLSLIAQRNLAIHTDAVNNSLERLSTGFKVNRSSDDAAGLNISEGLTSDIGAMQQALSNIQDGTSILQIAEGTLANMVDHLQRVRELAVQSANDTNSPAQRNAIELEVKTLITDMNRITSATKFNGINLLDGSVASLRIHIGPESNLSENSLDITSVLMAGFASDIGLLGAGTNAGFLSVGNINITTNSLAQAFLKDVDAALTEIGSRRAKIGAYQNQLEYTNDSLQIRIQNFTQSNSVIRDLDVAAESSNLVRSQILQQATVSVLQQANQNDTSVLSLLQN